MKNMVCVLHIAVLLLVSAVGVTSAMDPCNIYDASTSKGYYQYVSLSKLRGCVHNVKSHNVQQSVSNIKNLKAYLKELYAFGDIVKNSSDTDSTGVPYPSWRRYNVSVNYMARLDEIQREAESGASCFSVHAALTRLYNELDDAHTAYMSPLPFFYRRPVFFSVRWDEKTCTETVVLHSLVDNQHCDRCQKFMKEYQEVFGGPSELFTPRAISTKKLVSVNGVPAKEFFNSLLKLVGRFKDDAVKLNYYLRQASESDFLQSLLLSLPQSDFEEYKFDDGSVLKIELAGVYLFRPGQAKITSTEALSNILDHTNPIASTYWKLFTSSGNDQSKNQQLRRLSSSVQQQAMMEMEEQQNHQDIHSQRLRRLESSPGITKVKSLSSIGESEFAVQLDVSGVPLFRLNTFQWNDRASSPWCSEKGTTKCVLDLLYESIDAAKKSPKKRLMIDISSNGGGNIAYGHALVYALNKDLDSLAKLQGPVDIRMSEFWQSWLTLYGRLYQEKPSSAVDDKTLANLIDDWPAILELFKGVWTDSSSRSGPPMFVQEIGNILPADQVRTLSKEQIQVAFAKIRKVLWDFYTSEGKNSGWLPLDGNMIKYDATGKPVKDVVSFALDTAVTHKRGGSTGKYTPKFLLGTEVANLFYKEDVVDWVERLRQAPDTRDIEIVVISDGLCGSTCSLFVTKLLTSNTAKIVTFGGYVSQPLDSSSFSGGMVFAHRDFFRQTLSAYAAGYLVSGGKTLNKNNTRSIMPLFDQTSTSYTFLEVYDGGVNKNELPYEWYLKPGHYHLPLWMPSMGMYDVYQVVGSGEYMTLGKKRQDMCGGLMAEYIQRSPSASPTSTAASPSTTATTTTGGQDGNNNIRGHTLNAVATQDHVNAGTEENGKEHDTSLSTPTIVAASAIGIGVGLVVVGGVYLGVTAIRQRMSSRPKSIMTDY